MTTPSDRRAYLQGRIDAFEEFADLLERKSHMRVMAVGLLRKRATAARAELAAAEDNAPEEGQG
jgi:hypothetical protein